MSQDDSDLAGDAAEFLRAYNFGELNNVVSARLKEVVAACKSTGLKGSLTIRIGIEAKGDAVTLGVAVKTSRPEPSMPASMFFATEGGALSRDNPKQLKLPTKGLDAKPVRDLKPIPFKSPIDTTSTPSEGDK